MSTDSFYKDLASFSDFSGIGDLSGYLPVPEDWVVLAADIVRSRDAVAAGRYKDVNFIGAAVISAVLNRLGRDEIPFVFGGDGALLLVPACHVAAGAAALTGVARLARETAGLVLRTAAIPVAHLRTRGTDIKLRKFELSPGNFLAMAIGDGLQLAETILKDERAGDRFLLHDDNAELPNLEGLSCRWEPIPSRQGCIVSLMVKPEHGTTLSAVVDDMTDAIGFNPLSEIPEAQLITRDQLRFQFPPRSLGLEVGFVGALKGKVAYRLRALLECVVFVWGYTTGLRVGPFEPKRYLTEISRNTDHRKLDDTLRLVLDLSEARLDLLRTYLESAFRSGRLPYGLHVSDHALMTCFVVDMSQSQHVHFVDGADGGFSQAASDYQARLPALDLT